MQNTAKADRLPRLLSEQPAYEDRFGVHERIAEQLRWIIEEITRNGGETKKNVVALFGTWGSGKSTVINLLEKNVKNTYKVIRYDSWSHRDEHLKKAFLLHLLEELGLQGIRYEETENTEAAEGRRRKGITLGDVILGRTRHQIIRKDPETKIGFALFLLGLILLVGAISAAIRSALRFLMPMMSPVIESFTKILPIDMAPYKKIIIIILGFLGLVIILGGVIAVIVKAKSERFRERIAKEVLSPFLKIPLSVTETVVSSGDSEIPSIQFQKFFHEILEKWKEKKNSLPLIIVLDNLDRVDDETVSRFFSLIQSALDALKPKDNHNSENGTLQEQVVFIVPIDRTRVQQVLRKMIHVPEASQDSQGNGSFQEDFLKKLFPYAVEIPELVASNWRRFFKEKLREAFPWMDEGSTETSLVTGIFHRGIQMVHRSITPREIIHFLNEMVLHAGVYRELVHRGLDRADIVLIALYTAIERYDQKWRKELFNNRVKVPSESSESEDGEVQEHQESAESRPLLRSMISPYVGSIIPENYKERLLQLHYRTTDIWDLLLLDAMLDIISEGNEQAETIIDKIKPKLEILQKDRRKKVIIEILGSIIDEHSEILANNPANIGRFAWIAEHMDVYDCPSIYQRSQKFLITSLKHTKDVFTIDTQAIEGLSRIFKDDFQGKPDVVIDLIRITLNYIQDRIRNLSLRSNPALEQISSFEQITSGVVSLLKMFGETHIRDYIVNKSEIYNQIESTLQPFLQLFQDWRDYQGIFDIDELDGLRAFLESETLQDLVLILSILLNLTAKDDDLSDVTRDIAHGLLNCYYWSVGIPDDQPMITILHRGSVLSIFYWILFEGSVGIEVAVKEIQPHVNRIDYSEFNVEQIVATVLHELENTDEIKTFYQDFLCILTHMGYMNVFIKQFGNFVWQYRKTDHFESTTNALGFLVEQTLEHMPDSACWTSLVDYARMFLLAEDRFIDKLNNLSEGCLRSLLDHARENLASDDEPELLHDTSEFLLLQLVRERWDQSLRSLIIDRLKKALSDESAADAVLQKMFPLLPLLEQCTTWLGPSDNLGVAFIPFGQMLVERLAQYFTGQFHPAFSVKALLDIADHIFSPGDLNTFVDALIAKLTDIMPGVEEDRYTESFAPFIQKTSTRRTVRKDRVEEIAQMTIQQGFQPILVLFLRDVLYAYRGKQRRKWKDTVGLRNNIQNLRQRGNLSEDVDKMLSEIEEMIR